MCFTWHDMASTLTICFLRHWNLCTESCLAPRLTQTQWRSNTYKQAEHNNFDNFADCYTWCSNMDVPVINSVWTHFLYFPLVPRWSRTYWFEYYSNYLRYWVGLFQKICWSTATSSSVQPTLMWQGGGRDTRSCDRDEGHEEINIDLHSTFYPSIWQRWHYVWTQW